jgi:hypothetical protein
MMTRMPLREVRGGKAVATALIQAEATARPLVRRCA